MSVLSVIEGILKVFRQSKSASLHFPSPSVALRPIPSFLCRALQNSLTNKQYGLQSALLSLLCTVCSQFGSQWRCLLCTIGEETFDTILSMWENKTTPRQLSLLHYLNFQLIMHWPQQDGVYLEGNEYSSDCQGWKRKLRQLYLLIFEYLFEIEQMYRIGTGSGFKESVPEEFVTLAARLCSQIFIDYDEVTSLDITQIGATQLTTQTSSFCHRSKRRRVVIGFTAICDKLKEDGTQEGNIPWYRILCKMLKDHSGFYTSDRGECLLDLLLHVLSQCKSNLVMEEILRCLKELANPRFFPLTNKNFEASKKKWTKVAEFTTRLVAGKQCSEIGMQVLHALILNQLTSFQNSLCKLFARGVFTLNKDGLELLEALLINYPLPKVIRTEDYLCEGEEITELRISLINVLLPLKEKLGSVSENRSLPAVNHPTQIAKVLALLTLQNPLRIEKSRKAKFESTKLSICEEKKKESEELEQVYLKSLFSFKSITSPEQDLDFSENNLRRLKNVQDALMGRLKRFVDERVVENTETDVQKMDVVLILNICQMVVHLWPLLKDERSIDLLPKLDTLSKHIEKLLSPSSDSTCPWNEIASVFTQLYHLFATAIHLNQSEKIDCQYLQRLVDAFPSSFQDMVLQVVKSREFSSPSNTQLRNMSQLASNRTVSTESNPDFDPDFDEMDSDATTILFNAAFEECDSDNQNGDKSGSKSLSRASLSPKDEGILCITEWLAKSYDLTIIADPSADEDDLPFLNCVKTFKTLVPSEKVEDQVMVFGFVSLLISMKFHEENIEDGLEMLSKISGNNSNDSRVICGALSKLKELLSLNGQNLIDEHKQNVVYLIKIITEKLKKRMYGLNVSELIFENIVELVKLDPLRSWSSFVVNEDDRCSRVYSLMKSPYHDMRMKAVESVPLLFQTQGKPLPSHHQEEMFAQLYQIAIESLTVEGNLDESFVLDEGSCRVASFLSCLASAASTSSAMESQVLYAIVSSIKVNNVDVRLVERVLQSMIPLPHSNLVAYLNSHFSYLVAQWVRDKHPLDEFPFAVFGSSDFDSFTRRYINQIVSSAFTLDEGLKEIEKMAERLQIEVKSLIEDNFASIMATILPYLVASAMDNGERMKLSRSKISSATRRWKYVENALGSDLLTLHIGNDIGEVVLNLLRLGHDLDPWHENEIVVPPSYFHFGNETVLLTLNHVHILFFKDHSSLLSLLCKRKSPIHSVLHGLFSDVFRAMSSKDHRLRVSLASFETFLRAVIPAIGSQLAEMEYFIVRRLIHILTSFITKFSSERLPMAEKCCQLLHDLILACLNESYATQILITTLPSIVPRLHSLHSTNSIWNSIYEVLLPLFASESEPLKIALSNLAPFPNDGKNSQLERLFTLQHSLIEKYEGNVCLRKRIEKFVKISSSEITCYDIENVLRLLSEKKSEICELYASFLSNGSNVAHALVHKLVSIVSNTSDVQKVHFGLECLGKLGPVDLQTCVFAIQTDANEQFEHLETDNYRMFADIIIALNRLTFSAHLPAVEASVVSLRRVLSLTSCYVALKKLKDGDLNLDLMPFLPTVKPKAVSRQFEDLSIVEFERKIGEKSLWQVGNDFNSWLTSFTVALIEAGCGFDFFNHLIPVCKVDVNFCKFVLPYVFHHVLKTDIPQRRQSVSRMMCYMVESLSKELTSGEEAQAASGNGHVVKSCLRLLLNVINYLRTRDPEICFSNRGKLTNWERNLWLDLDFLMLAKAAFCCGSLFSAVLFAEISCNILQENPPTEVEASPSKVPLQNRLLPPLQRVATSAKGREISALLLQVYSALGASDGVEGCGGVSSATDYIVQSTVSLHRGCNMQALCISDAGKADHCLLSGLRKSGMYNVLYRMTQSPYDSNNQLASEAQAECAWRLGQWKDLDQGQVATGFNQCFYKALIGLKDKDETSFHETKDSFYHSTLAFLRENGNESTSNIYPVLTNLQIFSEFSEILKCVTIKSEEELLSHLLSLESSWEERENFGSIQRQEKEKIFSARISALKILISVCESGSKNSFQDLLFKMLIKNCEIGDISERISALRDMQSMKVVPEQGWARKLEEVKLAVSLDNNSQAICALEDLIHDIQRHESDSDEKLKGHHRAMVLYGQVLMKSRIMSPKLVIENYYEKAIEVIENKLGDFLEKCYHDLASLGDRLYQEINLALSSDHSQSRRDQMANSVDEMKRLKSFLSTKSKDPEVLKESRRKYSILERDHKREKNDFECQEKAALDYLNLALENYLKVLVCSSTYDVSVFRVIALWLENLTRGGTNKLMFLYSSKIKSHKFIPLLYQLVARLTCIQDENKHHPEFPQILSTILKRVCCDHPHHGLPVVLMLASAHLDDEVKKTPTSARNNSKSKHKKQDHDSFIEEDRVRAAKGLIEKLKNCPSLTSHIAELEAVYIAYITLANKKDKESMEKMTTLNSPLMKIRNLKHTAPLTRPIPIQPSALYSPPLIASWESSVELVGGINSPLKLKLYSSDGLKSYELLKGNDDLRQDAVLEQVFSVVNELLRKDSEASKHNLSIKTYLVVPLSQKIGIIQWCDNTTTLSEYLIEAHKKYYPKDFEVQHCRKILIRATKQAVEVGENNLESFLIQTMEEILENFHPVLRFFFYEEYPHPEKWFIQRRSYTSSVATSSIAGYILGVGDRHVQNLLLDTRTAEIIHIDLGIAFENGKLLRTPERVPFRMTQDIVDGFGAMGLEGPVRKNMETTMRVLREAKSVLTTIVEVLRHDPLHQWTLSPSQVAKLRQEEPEQIAPGEGANSASMAERAVIRVQQKLNGLEDGHVLSVPEHVSVLLQQATDIANLAQMFPGWQPYL